jgi:drug/metabolite transporter (DMT)-like permease
MRHLGLFAALLGIGAAWGLTLPLVRIAVSTGHAPLGLVAWQKLIMLVLLAGVLRVTGLPLPRWRGNLGIFLVVAVFGAVLPGYFTFLTADRIPAGIRAIIISLVPMCVLPLALVLGYEKPDLRRTLGVLFGAAAVVLIALPGAGVTPQVGLAVLLLALLAPASYAIEATYIAGRRAHGLDPFQLLVGASAVGLVLTWPLALATGQAVNPVPWGRAEWAMLAAGVLNAFAYSGYVWLIGRAGSLFASLIAYLVTGFGVVWSMLLLGERYDTLVWVAFAVMLLGITLVQPRDRPAQRA